MIDYIVKAWYNIIMGYIVFAISTISPLGAHVKVHNGDGYFLKIE